VDGQNLVCSTTAVMHWFRWVSHVTCI